MRTSVVHHEGAPALQVRVSTPDEWEVTESSAGAGVPRLFSVQRAEEGGVFADNVTLGIDPLPDGARADVPAVAELSRAQQRHSVLDLHLLDDREVQIDSRAGWFRALLQTNPEGITVVTRQVFTVVDALVITCALTSFPYRDESAARLFEEIVGTLRIHVEEVAR